MKKSFSVFILWVIVSSTSAQTVLENNPPSLKWYQVNTDHFKVLFPKGFEQQAQRVANTLEHIRIPESRSLGSAPRKISVILQNQSAVSNGFVSILPRRSEFYAMPSQDYNFIGTNDWLDILASHEYRHVVQYQHATRGFNRLFYYIFGATTLAGMSKAAAPDWFWEGDAVAAETAFTPSGRGRIPNFGLVFRTNLLEGREFNYHKQYLRSYKHNIPDEYVLGFYMVSYLRKRTNDANIWGKITSRSWSVPFIPFAFSNAIKKETGLYVTDLYREMAKDLKKDWQEEVNTLTFTPFEKVNQRGNKAYTDYLYPQVTEDGSILALKSGIGDIQKFVLLKDGKEKKFYIPGYTNDAGMLSAVGSTVVWNEYGYSPRWGVKNYSLVKSYDGNKKKKKVIGSKHERFGSAALSPDGKKVVTIRTDTKYQTHVVILDFSSGSVIKEFQNLENYFYSMPRWSNDGSKIAVLKTTKEGKTISILEVETEKSTDILPLSQENVGHPVLYGDYLFYNSPVSGIDNIYVVRLTSNEKLQVTSSRYGAYNPAISNDGKFIYYNDQTKDGLDVVKIPFDASSWRPPVGNPKRANFYQHLVEQEGHTDLIATVPQQPLPVKKYSKLKGLINPFTWGLNVDSDLTQATIGISSRDILSTTAIDLGYVYDINERTGAWQAELSYQGWFPIIDLKVKQSNRSVDEGPIEYLGINSSQDTITYINNLTFEWVEKSIEGGLRIPLITTSSRFNGNVTFANNVGYTSVSEFKNSIDGGGRLLPANFPQYLFRDYIDQGSLLYNNFSLEAFRLMKRSRRDINSKWGQRIFIESFNTIENLKFRGVEVLGLRIARSKKIGDFSGRQFSFYGIAYFPGFVKHHSLWGYWAFQHSQIEQVDLNSGEGLNNYLFRNRIPLPRGQSVSRFQDFYSMSANYTLPVWYPDIAAGPLLNFQRLRANVFLDYGYGESKVFGRSQAYTSAGVEVKLDLNLMRFYPQFDIGIRYTKGLSPSTTEFELLIGSFNF